jgi:hypothetical protein
MVQCNNSGIAGWTGVKNFYTATHPHIALEFQNSCSILLMGASVVLPIHVFAKVRCLQQPEAPTTIGA